MKQRDSLRKHGKQCIAAFLLQKREDFQAEVGLGRMHKTHAARKYFLQVNTYTLRPLSSSARMRAFRRIMVLSTSLMCWFYGYLTLLWAGSVNTRLWEVQHE